MIALPRRIDPFSTPGGLRETKPPSREVKNSPEAAGSSLPEKNIPLVEVENLDVRFGEEGPQVIHDISFALNRGECLALVGESGSGKSVTSRTLVGLAGDRAIVKATRLRLHGEDLKHLDEKKWREIRGTKVGFIMQDALGSLDPLRVVGDEIREPLDLHTSLNKLQKAQKVLDLLRSVGVPEPELRAKQYSHELSGGLRQRALIASAIACDPELLIADEPTTALDAAIQAQVLDLLESLRTPETSLLLVSHDFAVVSRLANRIAVMQHGRIVEQGTKEQILQDPQHSYTQSLLHAVWSVHSKSVHFGQSPLTPRNVLEEYSITSFEGEDPLEKSPVLLEATHITKSFIGPDSKKRTVVQKASFKLRKGETLGIVGESGSGKTTLARITLGLEKPDEGKIHFRGKPWFSLSAAEQRRERKKIQVIFQDPLRSFDPRYTVEKVIGEALDVIGVPSGVKRRQRTIELLKLVRLQEHHLHRRPIELSGGQRQRVAIARALAPEPEILVCDEPVSALDVSVQAQILELLDDLKARLGLSCIFISHDLGVVHHISDRVLVMKDGVIVEAGNIRDVFQNPRHEYTVSLLNAIPKIQFHKEVSHV